MASSCKVRARWACRCACHHACPAAAPLRLALMRAMHAQGPWSQLGAPMAPTLRCAVPCCAALPQESALVTLGWQCVELLCSDYLYMLPTEHISRALDVLALYAKQVRWFERWNQGLGWWEGQGAAPLLQCCGGQGSTVSPGTAPGLQLRPSRLHCIRRAALVQRGERKPSSPCIQAAGGPARPAQTLPRSHVLPGRLAPQRKRCSGCSGVVLACAGRDPQRVTHRRHHALERGRHAGALGHRRHAQAAGAAAAAAAGGGRERRRHGRQPPRVNRCGAWRRRLHTFSLLATRGVVGKACREAARRDERMAWLG